MQKAAKLAQYDVLESKVRQLEQYHAQARAADDLIGQMLEDGTLFKDEDGNLAVMGADGQMKAYSPSKNQ